MSVLLAENKKSNLDIIISPTADRVIRFAAKELQSYLKKITMAYFPVKEQDPLTLIYSEPAIILMTGPAPPANCSVPSASTDTFMISTRDKQICIWGKNNRCILYGVYEFLEILGCQFIEPSKEIIPVTHTLIAPVINQNYVSAFPLRNIFRNQVHQSKTAEYLGLNYEHHLPQIDWMAKRRLNHYEFYVDYFRYDLWEKYKNQILDALLDRGFDIEVTHHSILYFFPANEKHDFGDYGPSTYQQNHPDWFSDNQARIEIPAVQEVIKERYLEYIRNNPEVKMVGLWPGDAVNLPLPYQGLNHTDGYMKFWNSINKAMQSEFPEKRLSILAYHALLQPPQKVVPDSSLHAWFCVYGDNYNYPITDKRNKKYFGLLKEWAHQMSSDQVACFLYYGWMPVMSLFIDKMKQDLTVYKEMKLAGAYGWAGFTYNILGEDFRWARDLFVFSHLLWDPDQNVDSLEQKWAKGVFCDAAEDILYFYHVLKQAHEKESKKGLAQRLPWISLDLLHDVQKVLLSARSKTEDPAVLRRINLLEMVAAQGCTDIVMSSINPLGNL